jgi:hypothetical protein
MIMWKLLNEDKFVLGAFNTLGDAMEAAKYGEEFVTITDGTTEIVGRFGVDAVENKVLPDGTSYEWTMRRDENKSWRKKLG